MLSALDKNPYDIICLARKPEFLKPRIPDNVAVVYGDVMDMQSLVGALKGIHTAYFLIHSMGAKGDFEGLDRRAAQNFGEAARECNAQRIIYLGGLGDPGLDLSPHLKSRHGVGTILAGYGVQVIECRASIITGSGSLAYELIRALVERLPVMITPRWVSVKALPTGIADLLDYLTAALTLCIDGNRIFEIGGSDIVSYKELMNEYAGQRGLRRLMISMPVLTPRLSSLWLGLVTPLYSRIGKKLIESLRHETIVRNDDALTVFKISPAGIEETIKFALINEEKEYAETKWSDSVSSSGHTPKYGGIRFGNRLIDQQTMTTNVEPSEVFRVIQGIGGKNGWYYANWLWRLRGFIDLCLGGVGMRRGRRHPLVIRVGDTIDWWRLEEFIPDSKIRLFAEMKLPGRAWLEFEIIGDEQGSTVKQTAIFDPKGLPGFLYWYSIYPLHQNIFRGMIKGIAKKTEEG